MTWAKGQSGNPGGRPRIVAEVRELAQKHCPDAIGRLVRAMGSEDDRTAIAAATAILDRGIGRPVQETELSDAGSASLETREYSMNEAARRIAFILNEALQKRLAAAAGLPVKQEP